MRSQQLIPDWTEYGLVRWREISRREASVPGSVTAAQVGGEQTSGGQRCGGTKDLAKGSRGLEREGGVGGLGG